MPFLEIQAIHKTYEDAPLLRGVSFSVERGQIVSLLGPSGSGKTTLLRIIAGLERAESGRVLLEGADITGLPAHRRGVVLMFQEYALFPHRTVAENVAFGLRMRGEPADAIAARVGEMLALVGMEGFAERNVIELSGGERQRVALARSLAPRPRLLLLDEPLGALDRTLRERLLDELPAILRRVGVTAISVTHDQEEAFAIADHVVLLHAGDVVQAGSPEQVYRAPATAWVARFLGLTNLLPATAAATRAVQTALGALTLADENPPLHVGTGGTVLVHPWGIYLEAPRENAPNRFAGQVVRRTYHGRAYHLALDVAGVALHLTRDLGQTAPNVGAAVEGWLDPAALYWLPDPQAD